MVELTFLTRGAGIARAAERSWALLAGHLLVCHVPVSIDGPALKGWVLTLSSESVASDDLPVGMRRLPDGVGARCEGFFEALETELDRGSDADPRALTALSDLVVLCYERSPHSDLAPVSAEAHLRSTRLGNEIAAVIDRRFAQRVSLSDVAVELNRSTSSVARAARAATGHSVVELIAERRILEARRLLVETDLPVSEVAGRVGYSNVGHFHRAFRRSTSRTPRAWRAEAAREVATAAA